MAEIRSVRDFETPKCDANCFDDLTGNEIENVFPLCMSAYILNEMSITTRQILTIALVL